MVDGNNRIGRNNGVASVVLRGGSVQGEAELTLSEDANDDGVEGGGDGGGGHDLAVHEVEAAGESDGLAELDLDGVLGVGGVASNRVDEGGGGGVEVVGEGEGRVGGGTRAAAGLAKEADAETARGDDGGVVVGDAPGVASLLLVLAVVHTVALPGESQPIPLGGVDGNGAVAVRLSVHLGHQQSVGGGPPIEGAQTEEVLTEVVVEGNTGDLLTGAVSHVHENGGHEGARDGEPHGRGVVTAARADIGAAQCIDYDAALGEGVATEGAVGDITLPAGEVVELGGVDELAADGVEGDVVLATAEVVLIAGANGGAQGVAHADLVDDVVLGDADALVALVEGVELVVLLAGGLALEEGHGVGLDGGDGLGVGEGLVAANEAVVVHGAGHNSEIGEVGDLVGGLVGLDVQDDSGDLRHVGGVGGGEGVHGDPVVDAGLRLSVGEDVAVAGVGDLHLEPLVDVAVKGGPGAAAIGGCGSLPTDLLISRADVPHLDAETIGGQGEVADSGQTDAELDSGLLLAVLGLDDDVGPAGGEVDRVVRGSDVGVRAPGRLVVGGGVEGEHAVAVNVDVLVRVAVPSSHGVIEVPLALLGGEVILKDGSNIGRVHAEVGDLHDGLGVVVRDVRVGAEGVGANHKVEGLRGGDDGSAAGLGEADAGGGGDQLESVGCANGAFLGRTGDEGLGTLGSHVGDGGLTANVQLVPLGGVAGGGLGEDELQVAGLAGDDVKAEVQLDLLGGAVGNEYGVPDGALDAAVSGRNVEGVDVVGEAHLDDVAGHGGEVGLVDDAGGEVGVGNGVHTVGVEVELVGLGAVADVAVGDDPGVEADGAALKLDVEDERNGVGDGAGEGLGDGDGLEAALAVVVGDAVDGADAHAAAEGGEGEVQAVEGAAKVVLEHLGIGRDAGAGADGEDGSHAGDPVVLLVAGHEGLVVVDGVDGAVAVLAEDADVGDVATLDAEVDLDEADGLLGNGGEAHADATGGGAAEDRADSAVLEAAPEGGPVDVTGAGLGEGHVDGVLHVDVEGGGVGAVLAVGDGALGDGDGGLAGGTGDHTDDDAVGGVVELDDGATAGKEDGSDVDVGVHVEADGDGDGDGLRSGGLVPGDGGVDGGLGVGVGVDHGGAVGGDGAGLGEDAGGDADLVLEEAGGGAVEGVEGGGEGVVGAGDLGEVGDGHLGELEVILGEVSGGLAAEVHVGAVGRGGAVDEEEGDEGDGGGHGRGSDADVSVADDVVPVGRNEDLVAAEVVVVVGQLGVGGVALAHADGGAALLDPQADPGAHALAGGVIGWTRGNVVVAILCETDVRNGVATTSEDEGVVVVGGVDGVGTDGNDSIASALDLEVDGVVGLARREAVLLVVDIVVGVADLLVDGGREEGGAEGELEDAGLAQGVAANGLAEGDSGGGVDVLVGVEGEGGGVDSVANRGVGQSTRGGAEGSGGDLGGAEGEVDVEDERGVRNGEGGFSVGEGTGNGDGGLDADEDAVALHVGQAGGVADDALGEGDGEDAGGGDDGAGAGVGHSAASDGAPGEAAGGLDGELAAVKVGGGLVELNAEGGGGAVGDRGGGSRDGGGEGGTGGVQGRDLGGADGVGVSLVGAQGDGVGGAEVEGGLEDGGDAQGVGELGGNGVDVEGGVGAEGDDDVVPQVLGGGVDLELGAAEEHLELVVLEHDGVAGADGTLGDEGNADGVVVDLVPEGQGEGGGGAGVAVVPGGGAVPGGHTGTEGVGVHLGVLGAVDEVAGHVEAGGAAAGGVVAVAHHLVASGEADDLEGGGEGLGGSGGGGVLNDVAGLGADGDGDQAGGVGEGGDDANDEAEVGDALHADGGVGGGDLVARDGADMLGALDGVEDGAGGDDGAGDGGGPDAGEGEVVGGGVGGGDLAAEVGGVGGNDEGAGDREQEGVAGGKTLGDGEGQAALVEGDAGVGGGEEEVLLAVDLGESDAAAVVGDVPAELDGEDGVGGHGGASLGAEGVGDVGDGLAEGEGVHAGEEAEVALDNVAAEGDGDGLAAGGDGGELGERDGERAAGGGAVVGAHGVGAGGRGEGDGLVAVEGDGVGEHERGDGGGTDRDAGGAVGGSEAVDDELGGAHDGHALGELGEGSSELVLGAREGDVDASGGGGVEDNDLAAVGGGLAHDAGAGDLHGVVNGDVVAEEDGERVGRPAVGVGVGGGHRGDGLADSLLDHGAVVGGLAGRGGGEAGLADDDDAKEGGVRGLLPDDVEDEGVALLAGGEGVEAAGGAELGDVEGDGGLGADELVAGLAHGLEREGGDGVGLVDGADLGGGEQVAGENEAGEADVAGLGQVERAGGGGPAVVEAAGGGHAVDEDGLVAVADAVDVDRHGDEVPDAGGGVDAGGQVGALVGGGAVGNDDLAVLVDADEVVAACLAGAGAAEDGLLAGGVDSEPEGEGELGALEAVVVLGEAGGERGGVVVGETAGDERGGGALDVLGVLDVLEQADLAGAAGEAALEALVDQRGLGLHEGVDGLEGAGDGNSDSLSVLEEAGVEGDGHVAVLGVDDDDVGGRKGGVVEDRLHDGAGGAGHGDLGGVDSELGVKVEVEGDEAEGGRGLGVGEADVHGGGGGGSHGQAVGVGGEVGVVVVREDHVGGHPDAASASGQELEGGGPGVAGEGAGGGDVVDHDVGILGDGVGGERGDGVAEGEGQGKGLLTEDAAVLDGGGDLDSRLGGV